jgi:hypothetical protein
MILFLDFDGVLHPDAVYITSDGLELRAEGELFMWADPLYRVLSAYPDLQLVLSTSWVRHLGYHAARKALPRDIRERVIGATWHSAMGKGWPDFIVWDQQSRYEQIAAYLARRAGFLRWLAIDDDDRGWPDSAREKLVLTNSWRGLSDGKVVEELSQTVEPILMYKSG